MAYMYQAEMWCDDCGRDICASLKRARKAPRNPADETSFDSDDYPKYVGDDTGYADSPSHCGGGEHCLGAKVDLADYLKAPAIRALVEASEPRLRYVGESLGDSLTDYGRQYLDEMLADNMASLKRRNRRGDAISVTLREGQASRARTLALTRYWRELFGS